MGVWLDKASGFAEDLIHSEGGSTEFRFRVGTHALAACVGLRGKLGSRPLDQPGRRQRQGPDCRGCRAWPQGPSAMGPGHVLYDAMQLCQMRGDHRRRLKIRPGGGRLPGKGSQQTLSVDNVLAAGPALLPPGRHLCRAEKNHRLAVSWFDKALPLMEKTAARGERPRAAGTANRW